MRSGRALLWTWGVTLAAVTGFAPLASHAQSCLTSARTVERATAAETQYVFGSNGHAVDARNVAWLDIPDHALELDGAASGCWDGGRIDGPYPEDAVYECSSEHCPAGGCPVPCLPYHTTAGMAPNDGPRVIENVHIKDYGDGISVEARSGDVAAKGVWFENIHDDAMETDYAQQSLSCVDCLFERAFLVLAFDRRSSASGNTPKPGWTFELRHSLVQVHRFTNAYKQKPGHGGVFKDDPTVSPDFIVTDNTFLLGPVSGSGQVQFPLLGHVRECARNTVLWQGTQAAWEDMLEGGDSSDGATNGERLSALGHCYTVYVKPASQSAVDFRRQRWDPLVAGWKATHPAAGGSANATPAPTRSTTPLPTSTPRATPVPTRSTTPLPTSTPRVTAVPTSPTTPLPTSTPRATTAPTRSTTPLPTSTPRATRGPTPTPAANAPPQEPILLP